MANLRLFKSKEKRNPLAISDPYQQVYKLYNEDAGASKDFEHLHEKFRAKTFYEAYKWAKVLSVFIALFFGCMCIGLAFVYFTDLVMQAVHNFKIAGCIALVLLFGLEFGLKAKIIPLCVRNLLEKNGMVTIVLSVLTFGIIGASMLTTLNGSNRLFYKVGTQVEDVRSDKDVQIKQLREQQQSILNDRKSYQARNPKKTASWLGADEMERLNKQIEQLNEQRKEESLELSQTKEINTSHLWIFSLICEIMILLSLAFGEYYDWRSYREALVLNPNFSKRNELEVSHLSAVNGVMSGGSGGATAGGVTAELLGAGAGGVSAAENGELGDYYKKRSKIGFKPHQSNYKQQTNKRQQNARKDVITQQNARNEDKTTRLADRYEVTGKVLTFHQVSERLRTYKGFKKRGERSPATAEARINYYSFLLSEMNKNKLNRIEEVKYKKSDWLN